MKQEIVALRFDTIITNDTQEIIKRLNRGDSYELLTRRRMQLMAAMDLGPRWEQLAKGRTLFLFDSETLTLEEAQRLPLEVS